MITEIIIGLVVSSCLALFADQSPSVLVAATSSDSDSEDDALQSNNSSYDNQTPPCSGDTRTPTAHDNTYCLFLGCLR